MASIEIQDFKVCEDEKHDLECSICLFLVREAMEMPCSHLLCRECVEHFSLSTEETKLPLCCPLCKTDFKMSEIHRNTYADRMVRNLNIYCPRREHGCEWKGTIPTFFSKHEDVCDYKTKVCSHDGCSFSSIMKLLSEHEQICQFRCLNCQYCGRAVQCFQLNDHAAICPEFPIHCLNEKCEIVIPRNEMNEHVENECELTVVNCTFYSFGCHHKFERKKQEDHNQKSTTHHMTLMFNQSQKQLTKMENEIDLLKTENHSQNEKIRKQNAEIEKQKTDIENVNAEVQKQAAEIKNQNTEIEKQSKEIEQLKRGNDVVLNELLLKGADRWIRKKKINFVEVNYTTWFHKIFELMDENKLYRYNNLIYCKLKSERRKVCWYSNSKKEQDEASKDDDVIHNGNDGLLLLDSGDLLLIETETFDYFNHKNSSCFILHPQQQENMISMKEGITLGGYNCWYRDIISSAFYLSDFILVCLIKI